MRRTGGRGLLVHEEGEVQIHRKREVWTSWSSRGCTPLFSAPVQSPLEAAPSRVYFPSLPLFICKVGTQMAFLQTLERTLLGSGPGAGGLAEPSPASSGAALEPHRHYQQRGHGARVQELQGIWESSCHWHQPLSLSPSFSLKTEPHPIQSHILTMTVLVYSSQSCPSGNCGFQIFPKLWGLTTDPLGTWAPSVPSLARMR